MTDQQRIIASTVDGIGYTDGTEVSNFNAGAWQPGIMPGRKLFYLGMTTNIARSVTAGPSTEQAAPVGAPTFTHPAAGTSLIKGRYWFYYSFGTTASPSNQTYPSPFGFVDIEAGEKIAYTMPDALPAWAGRFNCYLWAAPLGPPKMACGLVNVHATGGPFDYTGTLLATTQFSSQRSQGIGSVMLPALTNGTTTTVTILETQVTGQSIIMGAIRRQSTTPAAGAIATIIWEVTSQTAGTGFVISIRNAGTAATIATDYAFDYKVTN